jgi:hypothetical protein
MAKGSCLCGAIAFEIDDAGVVASVACYCVNCRKVAGSQFGVYLQVKPSAFRWLSGDERVASYESSPGNQRAFCATCGSIVPIRTSYGAVRVPGGALDEDPGVRPDIVLFADSAPAWCAVEVASRRFADTGPPELWGEVMRRLFGG